MMTMWIVLAFVGGFVSGFLTLLLVMFLIASRQPPFTPTDWEWP
jgi:RsiW-degrading membrane proteinase PrsW (M82 family)